MAPLLPSESSAYSVSLPEQLDDDRLNLTIRTGAASTYTKSTVVVHGGLTVGFQLPAITIPEIELKLEELEEKDWNKLISNEIFYLNIITRKWARLELEQDKERPKPRIFHSIVFYDNSIYLFGGLVVDEEENQLVPTNDLWQFNIDEKQWICIDNGSRSGAVNRYDLTLVQTDYVSPEDDKLYPALVVAGGRSDLNQELNHITVYDLAQRKYVNNSQMNLNLNEIVPQRQDSGRLEVDPKTSPQDLDKSKLTSVSEKSFIISGTSSTEGENKNDDVLFVYSSRHHIEFSNPLVSLPVAPGSAGLRLQLSHTIKHNSSAIPKDLKYPSGGIFGTNILIGGNSSDRNEYQVYSFNRPSQKWTRLSIDSKKKACEIYLWKSFSWASHHKVLLLGSANIPRDVIHPTIQLFDLIVTVGLPITNIYHASAVPQMSTSRLDVKSSTMGKNVSFEAYSKYAAPSTKISSIRSVFPNFAVALGRNAFERYGSSLADFEFISADGEKVNVPIMLLRKRWGRCFDMLLAKAYSRAVYKLENQQNEVNPEASETNSVVSGSAGAKKSMMVFNKGGSIPREEREAPKFRLPFQDLRSTPPTSAPQSIAPNSRKASVVSNSSNMSGRTSSTTGDSSSLSPNLNFSNLPPQTAPPTEPLPPLDKSPRGSLAQNAFKNGTGFSPFSDSPRGSISGPSSAPGNSTAATSPGVNSGKGKEDLRTPVQNFKKRDNSRSSSFQTNRTDDASINDTQSAFDSFDSPEPYDETKILLEPLLTPRSLYLPFATSTVQAVAEFLFTGQLGDKWLFQPTTLDSFLLAKFYEIPLLYDLIAEALYAMIGKKEESLIKEYSVFVTDYQSTLKRVLRDDEFKINSFFEEHPHVRKDFVEIEGYLNTVDDGYLNVTLLRKASKASNVSDDQSFFKGSVSGQRRSSTRSRFGKSSLSKEVNVDENDDDIENEEEDDPEDEQPLSRAQANSERIKFNEESMSSKSAKKIPSNSDDYDDIDPITPLKPVNVKDQVADAAKAPQVESDEEYISPNEEARDNISKYSQQRSFEDEENVDPLTKMETQVSKLSSSNKTESETEEIQVPEGRFQVSKNKMERVKTNDSSSSQNELKHTTSDDDVGVGLGLLNGAELNGAKGAEGTSADATKATFGDVPDANLPTLENLASPDSKPPSDQLIQVIYEVSALACDMKLLLRAANALQMSKVSTSKRDVLSKELKEFELKHEEIRLREELILREEEDKRRKKEEEAAAGEKKIQDAMRAHEESKRLEEQERKNQLAASEIPDDRSQRERTPKRVQSSSNLLNRVKKNSDGSNDEESVISGKTRPGGLRSAFHSFRSISSVNLTGLSGRRTSPTLLGTNTDSEAASTKQYREHSNNPFHGWRSSGRSGDGSSGGRSIFSSFLPRRSHTSKH